MREIKFRAWDGEQLREVNSIGWLYGELYWIDTPKYNGPIYEGVKIMQYTGLKDKNGVEIYEGDVLKLPTFNKQGYFKKNVVIFEDGAFHCDCNLVSKYNVKHIEVINNIYENPELLEEVQQ